MRAGFLRTEGGYYRLLVVAFWQNIGLFFMGYQNLTGRGHATPISFRYFDHVTIMFPYQTPTRHALLAHEKRHLYFCYIYVMGIFFFYFSVCELSKDGK